MLEPLSWIGGRSRRLLAAKGSRFLIPRVGDALEVLELRRLSLRMAKVSYMFLSVPWIDGVAAVGVEEIEIVSDGWWDGEGGIDLPDVFVFDAGGVM